MLVQDESRQLEASKNVSHFWWVLPDYSSASSSVQTSLSTFMNDAAFETKLFANTNAKKSAFPNVTNKSVTIQTNVTPAAPTLSTTNPTVTKVNDNIDI